MAEGTAHEGKIRRVKRILYPLVKIIAYAGSSAEGYPKEIKTFFFLLLIDKSEVYGEVIDMKKTLIFVLTMICLLGLVGCESSDPKENSGVSYGAIADYPAAIMVDNEIYLLELEPITGEIDDSAIIGYTSSYSDTFPTKDGETNFNRELEMPYAKVDNGIAVLYENEWRLCTPKE